VPASAGASSQAEPVTLPSHSAAYLNNPPPAYPAISKRLGEQGRVVVRVLIDEQGRPQQAQLQTESGYARLDRAALDAVMGWRFVPGQRGGKAQAMWFSVPITFDLKPARD
jgi:protein TonB